MAQSTTVQKVLSKLHSLVAGSWGFCERTTFFVTAHSFEMHAPIRNGRNVAEDDQWQMASQQTLSKWNWNTLQYLSLVRPTSMSSRNALANYRHRPHRSQPIRARTEQIPSWQHAAQNDPIVPVRLLSPCRPY